LSRQLRQQEETSSQLVKRNASNVIEIGNLKAEVVMLKKEMDELLQEEEYNNQERERQLAAELASAKEEIDVGHSQLT
jgi:phage host-nuclease inhibitor protein Gam